MAPGTHSLAPSVAHPHVRLRLRCLQSRYFSWRSVSPRSKVHPTPRRTACPGVSPRTLASASMGAKRRSNLAFAPRRASSGSTPRCRHQLATANSRSPSSSLTASAVAAGRGSGHRRVHLVELLGIFARTARASDQSKPTRAARRPSFAARVSAGRPAAHRRARLGMRAARGALLRLLLLPDTHQASAARLAPANTCGCRRMSFSCMPAATAAKSNQPRSSAMRAWNTTWNSRSPSSSRRCRGRRARSRRRLRRPPRSCTGRSSQRSARGPTDSRAPDRAGVPSARAGARVRARRRSLALGTAGTASAACRRSRPR